MFYHQKMLLIYLNKQLICNGFMNLDKYRNGRIHFIGAGGAGMGPMALILHQQGFQISGSDLKENRNTMGLKEQGIPVFIGHDSSQIVNDLPALVVFSSAVGETNPELVMAQEQEVPCRQRGELLADLAASYRYPVAISGSHGKTTVSAMLVHIFKVIGKTPGFLIGGNIKGWETSGAAGNGDIFVTEVDESDGSHALVRSKLAVVTNVEDDHCWSVGGTEKLFENFKQFSEQSETLVYVGGELSDQLFADHPDQLRIAPDSKHFPELTTGQAIEWGDHQRLNAEVAITAAIKLGIDRDLAVKAMIDFPGVERRMVIHYHDEDLVVAEDYAHHPTEVAATISSLKTRFPKYRFTVVFQPHRYARLERYLESFAQELGKADRVFITPVFAAWVEKGEIDSATLAAAIGAKSSYLEGSWGEMAEKVTAEIAVPEIIVVLGAGDINQLLPLLISEKG